MGFGDNFLLRIGCLGAARIAPEAIVHPAFVRGDVEIAAVAGRDAERCRTFASRHGIGRVLPDYEALVSDPDIDLVYNPLPIHLHAEWTIRALEAGKHVLCEKPFAMNIGEAEAVLRASQVSGRRVIEAMHYRHHPAFRQVQSWLNQGRIGALQSIEASLAVAIPDNGNEIRHLPETGGGAFMDLGCYPLSYALALLPGDPVSVAAVATLTPRGVDETMTARLLFEGGVTAQLSCTMAQGVPTQSLLELVGDKGRILFDNPCVPHLGYQLRLVNDDGVEVAPINRTTTYFYQMEALVEALRTQTYMATEGKAILRQQRALDAVYEAAGLRHLRYR